MQSIHGNPSSSTPHPPTLTRGESVCPWAALERFEVCWNDLSSVWHYALLTEPLGCVWRGGGGAGCTWWTDVPMSTSVHPASVLSTIGRLSLRSYWNMGTVWETSICCGEGSEKLEVLILAKPSNYQLLCVPGSFNPEGLSPGCCCWTTFGIKILQSFHVSFLAVVLCNFLQSIMMIYILF